MSQQPLQIGLIGFGCVAQGFYQHLLSSDLPAEIRHICVKDELKPRNAPVSLITTRLATVLNDPEVDVIVELISDDEVAFEIAKKCFERGTPLISANKKMIAERLPQLLTLQSSPFYFEGAVAGSIPVIHNLQQYFRHQHITEIRAILNGSSNYILTQLSGGNCTFAEALKEAQEKGFAEADPTLDISGRDAANKLTILAYEAFDEQLDVNKIATQNLQELTPADIRAAQLDGLKIKQIATLKRTAHGLHAQVKLAHIDSSDPLYFVDQEYNAIQINLPDIGHQLFYGKGAGSLPTGAAVFHDLQLLLEKREITQSDQTIQKKVA